MNAHSGLNYELLALAGMALITFLIRLLPFLRIIPKFLLKRLEEKQIVFPTMFLTVLVIYCLKPSSIPIPSEWKYLVGCSVLVMFVHWIKRNTAMSLGLGTVVYLFIVNR